MSKNLSAKYYQENKERLQKKLVKDIKISLKKKKKKSNNMVVNDTKNLPEDEKQKLVEYRKKCEKSLIKHIDINKIVVSNKLPLGKEDFKYFTGYKDNKTIRTL